MHGHLRSNNLLNLIKKVKIILIFKKLFALSSMPVVGTGSTLLDMELRVYVNDLLKAIGESLDLPGLSLDENGHCVLLFDDKVVLNMELDEDKELLIIYSYLGEVPFEGRETIFETLLESNLFWKDTQGATIGIDKQTQTVVLAFPMELPLKRKEIFEERLALFVDVTESWINRLEKMSTEAELIANEEQQ